VNKVSNPRKPLRLNVGFIINAQIGFSRDFDFDLPLLKAGEDLTLADFRGLVKITRTPQGLLVQGNFSGNAKQECVRCLSEYDHPLTWEFLELYAFDRKSVTESGLIVPEDAHIDLQPLVREFALLEFPIKPLCKPDCKGLCVTCGENLNERDCGHRPENDSPFAALKQLLDN
jgi:uncharacterized protein